MNMIEPSRYEKDIEIKNILSRGLSKPKSLWGYLDDLCRALGFRYIFFDMAHAMIMTAAAAAGFIIMYPGMPERHIHAALFSAAPIFFIFIVLLTETAEKVNGLYELKMTCKYTVQQIAGFRVLCFSLMGAVFCTVASLYFSRLSAGYDFLSTFSLSLCALFLCTFLTIFIVRRSGGKWNHLFAMLLWMAISLLPPRLLGERWELFLTQIPVAVTASVAVAACALFLMEIKKLMKIRKREVGYYAGC